MEPSVAAKLLLTFPQQTVNVPSSQAHDDNSDCIPATLRQDNSNSDSQHCSSTGHHQGSNRPGNRHQCITSVPSLAQLLQCGGEFFAECWELCPTHWHVEADPAAGLPTPASAAQLAPDTRTTSAPQSLHCMQQLPGQPLQRCEPGLSVNFQHPPVTASRVLPGLKQPVAEQQGAKQWQPQLPQDKKPSQQDSIPPQHSDATPSIRCRLLSALLSQLNLQAVLAELLPGALHCPLMAVQETNPVQVCGC
jgi:hypothetical protein